MDAFKNVLYIAYIYASPDMTFPPELKEKLDKRSVKIIQQAVTKFGTKNAVNEIARHLVKTPPKKKVLNAIRPMTNYAKENKGKRKPIDYNQLKQLVDRVDGLKVDLEGRMLMSLLNLNTT